MKKDVLLIFKTHLDIGFTDYSEKVCERYLHRDNTYENKIEYFSGKKLLSLM